MPHRIWGIVRFVSPGRHSSLLEIIKNKKLGEKGVEREELNEKGSDEVYANAGYERGDLQ